MSSSSPPPSSSSSSTSHRLSKIEKHQQEDLRSIRANKKNTDKNYEDIGKNIDAISKNNRIARRRIKDLEATVATLGENYRMLQEKLEKIVSSGPAATTSSTSATPNLKKKANKPKQRTHQDRADKLLEIAKRSVEMAQTRSGLIEFNKTNPALPDGEKHVWERKSKRSKAGGTVSTVKLDKIVDFQGLRSFLATSASRDILAKIIEREEGKKIVVHPNPLRYWVFLRNDKLTTLSRDFRGGVGHEYMWTDQALLGKPSSEWIKSEKRKNDPRRDWVDPSTGTWWVPEEDVIDIKEEEDEEEGAREGGGGKSGPKGPQKGRGGSGDGSGDGSDSDSDSDSSSDDSDDDSDDDDDDGEGGDGEGGDAAAVETSEDSAKDKELGGKRKHVEEKQQSQSPEYGATSSDSSSESEEDETVTNKKYRVF